MRATFLRLLGAGRVESRRRSAWRARSRTGGPVVVILGDNVCQQPLAGVVDPFAADPRGRDDPAADARDFDVIAQPGPSARGQVDINEANNRCASAMCRPGVDGWWTDSGTVMSLDRATAPEPAEGDAPNHSAFAQPSVRSPRQDPHRSAAP